MFIRQAYKRSSSLAKDFVSRSGYSLPKAVTSRLDFIKMQETVGFVFLLSLALPGSVGTYVVAALTVILGASQELGSPQFIAAFLYSFALVVLLQFRDLTFNPARLDRQVRAQIDHELADLHSEIGEMIANTRSMLKLKEKKE